MADAKSLNALPLAEVRDVASQTTEEVLGEITVLRKAALSTKVAGRLEKVPLFVGDHVASGDVMATLEPIDFELSFKQSQAVLEASKAKLRQLEVGARPEEKRQAEEQLRQTQANMENAQSDYQRMKDLFQTQAVSKQALDSAEAKATVSEAQYAGAKQQKAMVDQGPRIEDKEVARASIRQLEAVLEMAKKQREYAVLRAPFSGVISMRQADEGVYVTPSAPIYTLVQVDPIIAAVDCPERMVPFLTPGITANVCIDALPGKVFAGVLERSPASIDSKTRTARAEFIVKNPQMILKPGMFVRATVVLNSPGSQECK
ncbi:MAG: efflux RND transporter periplasmic adaptor subunit [Candidatus Ozemobacteraceae bacterium]